jgi:transcriptional regulator with XRE-family HTH domain
MKVQNEDKNLEARAMNAASIFRKHGISQVEINEFLGASQGQISRLLAGKVRRGSRLFDEVCLFAERLARGVCKELVVSNDDLISALADT